MKKIQHILALASLLAAQSVYAQKKDTVYISEQNIKIQQLKAGKSVYLVYFRMSKEAPRTMTQFWTRNVKLGKQDGKDIIEITQSWEGKDSIVHTAQSICNAKTLKPLFHENWWDKNGKKTTSSYDYLAKRAILNGANAAQDTSAKTKQMLLGFRKAAETYHLNWHLDLETFSTLPFKANTTFGIPFYEAGFGQPEYIFYTITSEAKLTDYNNTEVDCWVLQHESDGNKKSY